MITDGLGDGFLIRSIYFYSIVNHNKKWDIKRAKVWKTTIGTEYPGYNTVIVYHGMEMTPEQMGNFTYGYLGYLYGFSETILVLGSSYAAGFPTEGALLENEQEDVYYIKMGYDYAGGNR